MGSISFQVVSGDVAIGTRTKTYAVADSDIARLVAAYQAGNASITAPQALLNWSADVISDTKRHVKDWERSVAVGALTDISAQ